MHHHTTIDIAMTLLRALRLSQWLDGETSVAKSHCDKFVPASSAWSFVQIVCGGACMVNWWKPPKIDRVSRFFLMMTEADKQWGNCDKVTWKGVGVFCVGMGEGRRGWTPQCAK
jgi:hypothetical protein